MFGDPRNVTQIEERKDGGTRKIGNEGLTSFRGWGFAATLLGLSGVDAHRQRQ
jgi:hypothetical protein